MRILDSSLQHHPRLPPPPHSPQLPLVRSESAAVSRIGISIRTNGKTGGCSDSEQDGLAACDRGPMPLPTGARPNQRPQTPKCPQTSPPLSLLFVSSSSSPLSPSPAVVILFPGTSPHGEHGVERRRVSSGGGTRSGPGQEGWIPVMTSHASSIAGGCVLFLLPVLSIGGETRRTSSRTGAPPRRSRGRGQQAGVAPSKST
ncbi:hypothetical protein LZ30DRAFT_719782 [Colletotrichum cereale]|nr:hypothetical protein LZ30DRAFT_719782 [Colletotrichum cereale]